jgi:hypothetical protein
MSRTVKSRRFWPTVLPLLVLSPLGIDFFRLLVQGLQLSLWPYPTCITEVSVLNGALFIAEGKPVYPSIKGLPFVVNVYNPLTYLVPAGIGRAFHLDTDAIFIAGKLVSYVSALSILVVLGWHVWLSSRDVRWVALLVCMLVYYHSSTLTDFFRMRPDTPGILLSLSGWVIVQHRPRCWILLAAGCFAASLGYKWIYISAPIAVIVQLALEGDMRALVKLTSALAALACLLVVGSIVFLGGGFLWHTVYAMGSNPMQFVSRSIFFYSTLVRWHWGGLLPLAILSALRITRQNRSDPLILYLVICFCITSVTHAKVGSDINYHGELTILMVLTVVTALWGWTVTRSQLAVLPLGMLGLMIWLPILQHGPGWNRVCANRIHPTPHCSIEAPPFGDITGYMSYLRTIKYQSLVLHDELSVRLGCPVALDWYMLDLLFDARVLDFEILERTVRERRFRVLVFPSKIHSPRLRLLYTIALRSRYTRTFSNSDIIELRVFEERTRDVPRASRVARCHMIYDAKSVEIQVLRAELNYRADPVSYLKEANHENRDRDHQGWQGLPHSTTPLSFTNLSGALFV